MRFVIVSAMIFFFIFSIPGPGADKVVLDETLRLEDGQADVFFKRPRRVLEIPGKWIYLLDDQRSLKFDAAGKGYGEVVPRGEGPGELTRVHYVTRVGGQLVLLSIYPFKVILAAHDGTFKREFRPEDQGNFYNLEQTCGERLLLSRRRRDSLSNARQGISELPVELSWMDLEGRTTPIELSGISEKIFLRRITMEGGRVAIAVNEACGLRTCVDAAGKKLYMAYTPRYAVEVVDLATGKRMTVLKRPHQVVDYYEPTREDEEEEEGAGSNRPEPYRPETFNDILAIHHVLGELWVITSDFKADRGFRVDRFNAADAFAGSVYLVIPGLSHPDDLRGRLLELTADRMWINEPDEDGNPVPVRYRVSLR